MFVRHSQEVRYQIRDDRGRHYAYARCSVVPILYYLHKIQYLVVTAEPHEENNCFDIVEAVHPFSTLAALPPDVYQGVPVVMI